MLYSIFYDNFKSIIEDELKLQFVAKNYTNMKKMIDDSINLVEYIANETAVLYAKEPIRKLTSDSKRWDDLQKTMQQNIILDKVNKITYICNECGLIVQPRNGGIELDLITPNMLSIIQEKDDPTKIFGFIYEINLSDTVENDLTEQVPYKRDFYKRHFVYYDVEGNHFKFDENNKIIENETNPENINPYQDKDKNFILPLVIFHKNYNENSIWDETSGNKLFSATKQIGVIATLFNYYLKNSSHKQPVITGNIDVQIPDDQILDVLSVLKITGENANIDLLDFQGNLDEFFQQIQHKIELCLNQEGLALDDFTKSGSPESGYKLQLKKEPLKKKVDEQKPFFRIYENELFEKIRIVNNAMYNEKINDAIEFSIDYAEYEVQIDPEETRKDRSWNLQHNMTNPLKLIMEDNPDIKTEAEAEKVYNENKKINDKLNINVNLDQLNKNIDTKINQIGGKPNAVPGKKNQIPKDKTNIKP